MRELPTLNSLKDLKKYLPLIAFLGGFFWDAFTLTRVVSVLDLILLSCYLIVASVVLAIQPRLNPIGETRALWALQFCFGALFSALTVLYFKSTGSYAGVLLVGFLLVIMVINEFFFEKTMRRGLLLGVYYLLSSMWFSFLFPHLIHKVGWIWFFLSCLFALVFTAFLWRMAPERRPLQWSIPLGLFFIFQFLWFIESIPPVPLVLKESLVGRNFQKSGYSCEVPSRDWYEFGEEELSQGDFGKLWYLSSVFAPELVNVALEHRWFYQGEDGWVLVDRIPLKLRRGGREEGWRFYSRKSKTQPGRWKVQTALQEGAVLGERFFSVVEGEGQVWERKALP